MLAFIKQNKSLLSPQVFKLITVYLCNALQFLCPGKNSTQHRQFLEQNCNAGTLTQLKFNIYECLLYLPNSFITGKISQILNPICSEVINERTVNMPIFYSYTSKNGKKQTAMMGLVEKWLSNEDFYILDSNPSHYLYTLSVIGNEGFYER